MKRFTMPAITAALLLVPLAGCGTTSGTQNDGAPGVPKVGMVLSGAANDHGYNEFGADAVTRLKGEGKISGDIHVPTAGETDPRAALETYAQAGYDLVIGWGLGASDAVFDLAKTYPKTHFVATGGEDILAKNTANVETWTYDASQLGYLSGYLAGMSKLSPVAVVDGQQAPFLQTQWAAFERGLRQSNPSAQMLRPIYTGSFEDAAKASQATTDQAHAGAKLIATNAEGYSAGVAAAAQTAGIATIGMARQTSDAAKQVNLGRVLTDMTPLLQDWAGRVVAGTFGHRGVTSTLANHSLVPADLQPVSAAPGMPADSAAQAAALVSQIQAGTVTIK